MNIRWSWCYLVWLMVFLSLAFRFWLVDLAFHDDLLSNAGWGVWIYQHGPSGFYYNNVWTYSWPTQPPLMSWIFGQEIGLYYLLITCFSYFSLFIATHHLGAGHLGWWFTFLAWFSHHPFDKSGFFDGQLISLKIGPILADLGIAGLCWWIVRRPGKNWSLWMPVIYLLSPFSWYLSALWGQNDQIAYFFLLLSFVLLYYKREFWSPLILSISLGIKPTGLIFVPLFLALEIIRHKMQRKEYLAFLIGCLVSLGLLIWQMQWFNNSNFWDFTLVLIGKVFFKSEFRLTTNAFNFWRIFVGNQAFKQNVPFFFIPSMVWGYLITLFIYYRVIKSLINRHELQDYLVSLFLVGFGTWLFMTNMLDRYAFAGIVSLLLVCKFYPSMWKYWVVLSVIFWLNLFHGWWFPGWLSWLKIILLWQDGLVTRFLSLINVIIYLRLFWLLRKL